MVSTHLSARDFHPKNAAINGICNSIRMMLKYASFKLFAKKTFEVINKVINQGELSISRLQTVIVDSNWLITE